MTDTPKETGSGPSQGGGSVPRLEARLVPIRLTASPDLVDLAREDVADGSISNPETPALLRRIVSEQLTVYAAFAAANERPVVFGLPITEDFFLVDYEIRPGVRGYRLAKVPKNDPWRIAIGAFERRVHRTLVILVRRVVRFLTDGTTLAPEWKAGLLE